MRSISGGVVASAVCERPGERRTGRPLTGAERGLLLRFLSAAVGIPLVALVIWVERTPWPFIGFVLLLTVVAQWELYRMFGRVGIEAPVVPGLLLGALVVLAFAFGVAGRAWLVPLALSFSVAASLAFGLWSGRGSQPNWTPVALLLLGVCYCAWLLGHAIWLRALPGGAGLTFLLLAVTWSGESAAYFVGRAWGRHRLAPRISPAKTLEGAAAQLAVSVVIALLGARLLGMAWVHGLGIGLVLGIVGQLGDLAESFLKRNAAAKDAGGIVPGHGGLLDRLDSLLFNVPALYYYLKVFLSHG